MKTTSLFKVFNSMKSLKLEDIKLSSILDSVKSLDLNPNSIRSVLSDFVLIRRNRLIISSGLASILLLSLLPPQIELVLNRRSTLSQYESEDSLLDQLQVELDNVKSQLISRNKLKDSISELIPDQDEAKTIPLLLTSLLNSSSLSLVEIVPINESSYVSDSDEDSLADLENLFDEDNGEDFYSPDEESNLMIFLMRMILRILILFRNLILPKMISMRIIPLMNLMFLPLGMARPLLFFIQYLSRVIHRIFMSFLNHYILPTFFFQLVVSSLTIPLADQMIDLRHLHSMRQTLKC